MNQANISAIENLKHTRHYRNDNYQMTAISEWPTWSSYQ